jgi:hypothetical protein
VAPIDRRTLFRTGAGLAAGAAASTVVTGFVPGQVAFATNTANVEIPTGNLMYLGAYDPPDPDPHDGYSYPQSDLVPIVGAGHKLKINHCFKPLFTSSWTPYHDQFVTYDIPAGRIPMLSLYNGNNPNHDLADLQKIADGGWNDYLDQHAGWLRELRDSQGSSVPVFLRFGWEMNLHYAGHGDVYVDAWRNVVTRFRNAGATNVSFVWCPTHTAFDSGATIAESFYPHNDYVDWIAADGYSRWDGTTDTPSFASLFSNAIQYAASKATQARPVMPFMVGETAAHRDQSQNSTHQASWISAINTGLTQNHFATVKAIVFFQADGLPGDTDTYWRIEQTAAKSAFATLAANPRINW